MMMMRAMMIEVTATLVDCGDDGGSDDDRDCVDGDSVGESVEVIL